MYSFVKIWLQLALQFYCTHVEADPIATPAKTPAILASNHPNSFFDALIIAAIYSRQIHFLARGDAFNKPWAAWILRKLNLIPIYRLAEGKENLGNNEQSFAACMEVFKRGGTVLIFSEGLSEHEWQLRPLKKGTARLAYLAWEKNNITDLVVQPVGITYHSFTSVPKDVKLSFAAPFTKDEFELGNEAVFYNHFNAILKDRIEARMVLKEDMDDIQNLIPASKNTAKLVLLAIPAFIGYITQKWYYILWKNLALKKTRDTVFYDSVLFAGMMLTYPVLIFIVTMLFVLLTGNNIWCLLFIMLPFTAWAYKEYKSLQGH